MGLRSKSSNLAAPLLGAMEGRIEESMQAELHLTLKERTTGMVVYSGVGTMAGLEIAGPVEILIS
jgi:hypothetical protein